MEHMVVLTTTIYFVAFLFGPLGNGLVIYVTGFKMKKTVNTVWFLNLAVADFLFTAFLLFDIVYIIRGFDWPFGDFLCKINSLVGVLNMFASIFFLTAISVDRCLITWLVVWAQNKRTARKAEIISVVIWLAAFGCSLPYSIFRQVYQYNNITVCGGQNISETQYRDLVIFRFMVGFLFPFLIILGSYLAIGKRIISLHKKLTLKPFRIILAVILAFFLCWLPFHIFQFLELKAMFNEALQSAVSIGMPLSTSLAFLNSCLNPILYVFVCKDVQQRFRQSLLSVLETVFSEDHLLFINTGRSTTTQTKSLNSDQRKKTAIPLMTCQGTSVL